MNTVEGASVEPLTGNRPTPPSHMEVPIDKSSKSLFKPKFKRISKYVKGC